MSEEGRFTIHLEHLQDYQYKVRFDWDQVPELLVDEPPPLGGRAGPNASRLLAAAAANCLSASLMFCVSKNEVSPASMRTAVTCRLVRNEKRRLRIGGMEVKLIVSDALTGSKRFDRCKDLFEDFCVVSASLRDGFPVSVAVLNERGETMYQRDA